MNSIDRNRDFTGHGWSHRALATLLLFACAGVAGSPVQRASR